MSLDSKQEALNKLIERYGNTCGWNNPLFESGRGVAWERLIKDVENLAEADQPGLKAEKAWVAAEEALAEAIQKHSAVGSDHVDHTNARVEACRLALRRAKQQAEKLGKSPTRPKPWTSAEAAGLLNLSQKVFREFAKGSSPTGPLLPDDRTHAAIGIARLLEWADAHPRLRRWRESRETGKPLGQRVPMPPQTRFKVVQEVQVDFSLIEGKVSSLDLSKWSEEEREMFLHIWRSKAGALQVDERGIAMLQTATLPHVLQQPWVDQVLKDVWVNQYTKTLGDIQSELQAHFAQVQGAIPHLALEEGREDGEDAYQTLVKQWTDAGRELAEQMSEVRAAILDVTLPPAQPRRKPPPFRF